MYTSNSFTITEDYKAEEVAPLEWLFQIENGNTGEMVVSEALLDSEAIASERAESEFLKNSYKLNEVRFTTHRTDLIKNMTINLYGIPYLIKSINTTINEASIKSNIRAVRYD